MEPAERELQEGHAFGFEMLRQWCWNIFRRVSVLPLTVNHVELSHSQSTLAHSSWHLATCRWMPGWAKM